MRELESTKVKVFNRIFEVYGHADDEWFRSVKSKGVWEEFRLSNLTYLIAPGDICLDLGANIGMMTLALSMLAPRGHVYAFEGSPETTAALQRTVQANGLKNVSAYNTVLGRNSETVKFFDMPELRSSGHYVPMDMARETTSLSQDTSQVIISETKSVDQLVEELKLPKVDFIKIDVEGAELDVLAGAENTLKKFRPVVIMEFNSYAYIHLREIAPRKALTEIFKIFDDVFYFRSRTEELVRLENTEKSREKFLHDNLFHGFVDDLLCVFSGAQMIKPAGPLVDVLQRELQMRDTKLAKLWETVTNDAAVLAKANSRIAEQDAALAEANRRIAALNAALVNSGDGISKKQNV